jgi:formylglycine-generating enzyme required for sulfatase activity
MVCHDTHRCVTPLQIEQCVGKTDGVDCEIPGVPGRCRQGACVVPYCGDGIIDPNIEEKEECEGSQLDGKTCQDLGFAGGTLACKDCRFDVLDCYKCGDGSRHDAEPCEGGDLAGKTCTSFGFNGGALACESCSFSFRGCATRGFVHIESGTFMMGSPESELCRDDDETQHQVTLTHSFELSEHEVTHKEFKALMGYDLPTPYTACGSNCPVDNASWDDAAAYCNALSEKKGLARCYGCTGNGDAVACTEAPAYSGVKVYDCPGYRLPTEAEWEYAYRAGSDTPFYPSPGNDGTITICADGADPNADRIGWFRHNSEVTYAGCSDLSPKGGASCSGPHAVRTKAANAWGLHDLAGNVWEWCHDRFQKDLGASAVTDPWGPASGVLGRVIRGGPWSSTADFLRAAARSHAPQSYRLGTIGFRPCRTKAGSL